MAASYEKMLLYRGSNIAVEQHLGEILNMPGMEFSLGNRASTILVIMWGISAS